MSDTVLPTHIRKLILARSEAYHVFAKVLEDLYSVVDAIDCGAIDPSDRDDPGSSVQSCHPNQETSAGPLHPDRKTLGVGTGTGCAQRKASTISKRKVFQPSSSRSNTKITKSKKPNRFDIYEVDCPEYKHHIMYNTGTPPSCHGCHVRVMSQLRSHLNRVNHHDFLGVWQCPRCKRDFINQQDHDTHRDLNNCSHQAQARGDILTSWVRLYLEQYPAATRVPNPSKLPQ